MAQIGTEQWAIEQIEEYCDVICEMCRNDDKTARFPPMVIEYIYFMCDIINNQPQWIEDWLNWYIELEMEDFGAIPSDTYSNLLKQIERRIMFKNYIESM